MNRHLRVIGHLALVAASVGAGWAARGARPSPPPPVVAASARPPLPCLPVELPLDTGPNPPPAPPRRPRSPSPQPPVADGARHVRITADEDLPSWVPPGAKYRYTVVESSTIAENVGLLPLGTAAAHPDWTFDVVALIEAEREGHPVCPPGKCVTPADVPEDAFLAVSHAR